MSSGCRLTSRAAKALTSSGRLRGYLCCELDVDVDGSGQGKEVVELDCDLKLCWTRHVSGRRSEVRKLVV